MTITKTAMGKLFADLNPEDTGAIAAALADFARVNRPNSSHRLPVALAARLRDFAVECGVDESAVTVADPSHGYSAIRFTPEATPFLERLCALGLATDMVQAALAVYGPAGLVSACADAPAEAGDPAEADAPVPEPLVPAVAAALSNAAVKFLDQTGPLAELPSHICTPGSLECWAVDNGLGEAPDIPEDLDIGDFNVCVREMRARRNHPGIPSLPAIETALIYLGLAPELPNDMERVFYGLAYNAVQPALGRYVADGEIMPDFRLLLSDIPGEQCNTGREDNPLTNYFANDTGRLEALRGRGAAAFLCFGSAFLTRKDTEVLAFASDTKAFWGYVRELYIRWVALGDPDIGVALREGKLRLVFHPFSRVGLRNRDDRAEYADMSEDQALDHSMVGYVAGDLDSDLRSGEFDYTDSDDEDDDEREARFEQESILFRSSCAAAVYGFAMIPGASEVADGVKAHDTVFHVVRDRRVAVYASEDDEGAEDRLGVDDLPLEWSALIHGLDIRTVSDLRGFFKPGEWAEQVCWSSATETGFPAHSPARSAGRLGQPNMVGFLSETLRAFRAMSDSDCVSVPKDDQSYTVPAAHNGSRYVTAVYTGMTVSTSPAFGIDKTPGTFSVPASLYADICGNQGGGLIHGAEPEVVTEWLEHLSACPEVQLKCAKRKSGDTAPRTAWVVVETNIPFDKVQHQCNDLYLGDTLRVTRDLLRSLFTDAVIRGQRTLYNRFFQVMPGPLPSDDARLAFAVVDAAGCCPDKDAAARVVTSQIPSLFASDGAATSWTFTPNELRKYVKVSLAADKYNRLVVVVAVDGGAANVARLRYRVPGGVSVPSVGVTRFGVFTASMMRAYRAALENPSSPFDVFIAPGTDWETARPLMFRAVSHAARYGNVFTMDPPYGGLTTLMLAPRGGYTTDEPYLRTDYTPYTGVRVADGAVRALRGFEPELPL